MSHGRPFCDPDTESRPIFILLLCDNLLFGISEVHEWRHWFLALYRTITSAVIKLIIVYFIRRVKKEALRYEVKFTFWPRIENLLLCGGMNGTFCHNANNTSYVIRIQAICLNLSEVYSSYTIQFYNSVPSLFLWSSKNILLLS